jgi:hypothetical protein
MKKKKGKKLDDGQLLLTVTDKRLTRPFVRGDVPTEAIQQISDRINI